MRFLIEKQHETRCRVSLLGVVSNVILLCGVGCTGHGYDDLPAPWFLLQCFAEDRGVASGWVAPNGEITPDGGGGSPNSELTRAERDSLLESLTAEAVSGYTQVEFEDVPDDVPFYRLSVLGRTSPAGRPGYSGVLTVRPGSPDATPETDAFIELIDGICVRWHADEVLVVR